MGLQEIFELDVTVIGTEVIHLGSPGKVYYLRPKWEIVPNWPYNLITGVESPPGTTTFSDVPEGTYFVYEQTLSVPLPIDDIVAEVNVII